MIRHRITHGICPQYRAVLEYAKAQGYTLPSLPQQKIANSIIDYLVHRGQWSEVYEQLLFEATDGDNNFALINYINPGTYNGLRVGTPTFTTNQGYTANSAGTSRINLVFNPFLNASAKFTRRDHSFTFWRYTNTTDAQATAICGRIDSTNVSLIGVTNPSTGVNSVRAFDISGDGIVGLAPAALDGLFTVQRKDSGVLESAGQDTLTVYYKGATLGFAAIASAASTGRNLPNTPYIQASRRSAAGAIDKGDPLTPYSIVGLGHGTLLNPTVVYKALNYYMSNL